eukprot:4041052-Amphidinium_carterae.2
MSWSAGHIVWSEWVRVLRGFAGHGLQIRNDVSMGQGLSSCAYCFGHSSWNWHIHGHVTVSVQAFFWFGSWTSLCLLWEICRNGVREVLLAIMCLMRSAL